VYDVVQVGGKTHRFLNLTTNIKGATDERGNWLSETLKKAGEDV
jgi:hypothetical protein